LNEERFNLADLESWIEAQLAGSLVLAPEIKRHIVPVCYEMGADLGPAANALGMSSERLINLHLSSDYQCYAVGFSPGFAYLGYLAHEIATLPRLPAPRTRVPPGSVGITGRQTAVYPSATPGGWNLIGRCPLTLVDQADNYFPIEAGDRVEFRRIDGAEFESLAGERL
jgi:inhibitor of KinA